jgi:GT2 family glycosyltransferase/peptidoglycan/xylan/chitin deacetylase (PgdA/CDA1 family)
MEWTIVIPTWRRTEMLRELLHEIEKQVAAGFEVVIVSDGDDPATHALSENFESAFPVRWIFHEENLGLAVARNTGAGAARGEYLLFLDDDILPSANLISEHAQMQDSKPTWPGSVVCGRIIEAREATFRSKTDQFMQRAWEQSLLHALPENGTPHLTSVGAEAEHSAWFGLNCSISKELFEQFGGFDPKMRSDEEMEFGLRLYRGGILTRYAPNATVRHRGSKDMSAYYPRCWRLSGELDVHRVLDSRERSEQLSQVADLHCGGPVRRMMARLAWQNPEFVLGLARGAERITNMRGSRGAFGAWARLRHAGEYWSGVRATGVTKERLKGIAGAPRPILMFHSISMPQDSSEATYYTSPRRFRRFLSWLRMRNYTHIGPPAWLSNETPKRGVLLTFDDAYDDLYKELLPAIAEFELRPLVFVVTEKIGGTNDWDERQGLRTRLLLTLAQMREMQKHGVTFGSHSATHPLLSSLSDVDLRREVNDSKAKLEDALGTAVEWFAYPFGDVDRRVRAAVLEAGYRAAVTTNAGFNRWQDPLALNRLEIDDRDWLLDFALKLASARSYRRGLLARLGVQD